jgi:hypothetical protein
VVAKELNCNDDETGLTYSDLDDKTSDVVSINSENKDAHSEYSTDDNIGIRTEQIKFYGGRCASLDSSNPCQINDFATSRLPGN